MRFPIAPLVIMLSVPVFVYSEERYAKNLDLFKDILHEMKRQFEPDPEFDKKLESVDVGFVYFLFDDLKRAGNQAGKRIESLVLAKKYIKFQSQIPEEDKDDILGLIIQKAKANEPQFVDFALYYLSEVNRPIVRDFAREFVDDPRAGVRENARKILLVEEVAPSSKSRPPASGEGEYSTQNKTSAQVPQASTEPIFVPETVDKAGIRWVVISIAIVVIILFFLKRRGPGASIGGPG